MGCNPQVNGFQFVDDMTSYGTHRWGWVSNAPGDSIELQVRTPCLVAIWDTLTAKRPF